MKASVPFRRVLVVTLLLSPAKRLEKKCKQSGAKAATWNGYEQAGIVGRSGLHFIQSKLEEAIFK
jgi:hypothetical protein